MALLSTFNLWFRIPGLFLFFVVLSWLTAGTPIAFTLENGLISAALLTVGSLAAGLLFVVLAAVVVRALGVTPERRRTMKVVPVTSSVAFMTLAFWGGAVAFPDVYSVSGIFGALVLSAAFNFVLMLTLPTRKASDA